MNNFKCTNCNKDIIVKSGEPGNSSGLLLKSKLIFLNDNGEILCKCKSCKSIIALPFTFENIDTNINKKDQSPRLEEQQAS